MVRSGRLTDRPFIDVSAWKLEVLERRWQRAQPFPHIVMSRAIDADACAQLTEALDNESASRLAGEIYEMNATGEDLVEPATRKLCDELGSDAVLAAVAKITAKPVTTVKARGYAYTQGHYLLPHADRDADALRQIAFALYVTVSDDLAGGELELFDCTLEVGQIIATDPAGRIQPRTGALVLFDVSEISLHQVREVTAGVRGSISGWFY